MVVSAIWASKLLDLHCPKFKYCLHSLKNLWKAFHKFFRTLKSDLNCRPIFPQKEFNIEAYLNLAVLAYFVVSHIRYRLKQNKISHSWTEIISIAMPYNLDHYKNDFMRFAKSSAGQQNVVFGFAHRAKCFNQGK